jgi:EmrB/QacA subfamily drug resistance transporter
MKRTGESDPRGIALIVATAFFMEMLDGSVIATALPSIAADYGENVLGMSLAITAYLLAMAAFVPTAGWCADRFGARRVFATAVGLFTIASLLCGLAPFFWAMVAARVVQGAAAAYMSPVGRLIVLRETPQNRIIEALSTIVWPALIAPVVGPPLGGLIVTYVSWRWIFLLNVPLGLIGVWLILRNFPEHGIVDRGRFDRIGFALTAIALVAFIEGLTRLGGQRGNLSDATAMVVIGLACGLASIWHARRTESPLLDLRAIGVRTYAIAVASAGFVSRIAINASPFLLPLMFQVAFGMTALQAGAMVLVYMCGNLTMKGATTRLLRRFGFRDVLFTNGLLCAATLFACGMLSPQMPRLLIYPVLFAAGMTRSLNFTTITTLAFADVRADERAGASTLATMLQQVSVTLGVAVAAFVLALSQTLRGAASLALADFRHAWFVAGALMAAAALGALSLSREAGSSISEHA